MADSSSGWGWKAGLSAAICGAIIAAITGSLAPFWAWLQNAIVACISYLAAPSAWPNWIAYLLTMISVMALIRAAFSWIQSTAIKYKDFTQFNFRGAVWRWSFDSGRPHNVWCYCGTCDGTLVYSAEGDGFYSDSRTTFHCEHCERKVTEFDGTKSDVIGVVSREIERQIRTGEWEQHVSPKEQKT